MRTISYIICNSGDGSNHIEWYNRALTDDELSIMQDNDFERYSSGDGVQYQEIHFSDMFDIPLWASINGIKLIEIPVLISS